MSDPTPAPSDKTVVIDNRRLSRLWTLTIISLSLNGLIILFLLLACICHHHKKHHGFGGRGGWDRGQMQGQWGDRDQGQGFHRFGGDWGRRDGGDRDDRGGFGNQDRDGGGMGFRKDFGGGDKDRDWGGPGGDQGGKGPGMGGFGGRGMMGGGTPPDPAKMTDGIVDMLTKKLTLTDDQKAKIKPIVLDQVTTMQKNMEAQRQAMQKQIDDTKAKIKPILTADQQKQFDALRLPGQKPAAPAATPAPASDSTSDQNK